MRSKVVLVLCGMALQAWPHAAAEVPVVTSPGSPTGAAIGEPCPTFNWGGVDGATSNELVVYRIGADGSKAELVLRRSFPAAVSGWTPSLESCFSPGTRYAWTVRAIGPEGESEWAVPHLFEVPAAPSAMELEQALSVVRRYFDARGEAAPVPSFKGQRGLIPAIGGPPIPLSPAAPLVPLGGDPALQVNGSPVVTLASQLFALVAADGTLTAGSHVTGVVKVETGEYEVTFDRNVSNCAYTATIGEPFAEPAGLIDTARFSQNIVTVFTQDPDGAPPDLADRAFHLVVTCAAPG